VRYFDVEALEKKYPLPPFNPGEGALYVPVQRFKARQVLWGSRVIKTFSVAFVLFVALIGNHLYHIFSPGLTPEQHEFLFTSIGLLVALSACFTLATYYLGTRMVGDVFDRWYYLTDEFVESYHKGSVKRIYWKEVKKKRFWSFGHFRYGRISTGRKIIVFTINFVRAYPRPGKVSTGLMGTLLIYDDGRKVKLQDAQKEIFEQVAGYLD